MEISDEPQGFVLGPVLFNIFISDVESEIECKSADGMKLTGAADKTEGGDAFQRYTDKLEKWAHEAQ